MGNDAGALKLFKHEAVRSVKEAADYLASKPDWSNLADAVREHLPDQAEKIAAVLQEAVEGYVSVAEAVWEVALRDDFSKLLAVQLDELNVAGTALRNLYETVRGINPSWLRANNHAAGAWDLTKKVTGDAVQKASQVQSQLRFAALHADLAAGLIGDLDDGVSALERARHSYEELLGQVKGLESSVSAAAAKDLVTKQMSRFGSARAAHRLLARRWLCAGGLAVTILLLLTAHSVLLAPGPPLPRESWTVAANLAHFSARALVVVILSFSLVVFIRNYRAEKHNEETNGHRLRALGTLTHLLAAAGDAPETQRVILVQAASAIFTPQDTGFTGHHAPDRLPLQDLVSPGG